MEDRFSHYSALLREHMQSSCSSMARKPAGQLKYPYISPTTENSPFYSNDLWDWDSWLAGIALAQLEADSGCKGEYSQYERGCVLNFLDHCTDDGFMPICLTPSKALFKAPGAADGEDSNMHKPVIAQQIASLLQRDPDDTDWIRPLIPKLSAFLERYLKLYCEPETGLMRWKDDFAVGVDNDPSVFYRPANSCGSIYLNSLMARELLAMGYILEMLGDMSASILWRRKADSLKAAIQRWCWDERDGAFYSVDFALNPVVEGQWLHRGAPRDYPCLLMRIDSWPSFLPLWAGLCTREQAERMVSKLTDPRTYACRGGVRSLSKLEKMYDLRASNNPSNWCGPVWGISNFMIFSGLVKYGFTAEAEDLAKKTVLLFGRDLEQNGCLHEYYDPDTCEPIVTHGFENWNCLVLNMLAWLEGRKFVDTF